MTGEEAFADHDGQEMTANPSAPGSGDDGYYGEDGAYRDPYSWGIGVDSSGAVGASADIDCPGDNEHGGRGGDGGKGGDATAGGVGGGMGGFGYVAGGLGGDATLNAANGGYGGKGGRGGHAKLVQDLCGIERAHAGDGGDGGEGGRSGGGGATGGEGGPSYILPGRGGNAKADGGTTGKGGGGGNGGNGDSLTYCSYYDTGTGECMAHATATEPAGEWGCGGKAGGGDSVQVLGGKGGLYNETPFEMRGIPGQPAATTHIGPTSGGDGVPGDGSPRNPECATGQQTVDLRELVLMVETLEKDLPSLLMLPGSSDEDTWDD